MARTSGELSDREGIAALAMLARRREAGLRAALARMTTAAREADADVIACERTCNERRGAWQDALSRGGVYAPREAAGASRSVEAERQALAEATSRHSSALTRASQAQQALREQREQLHDNARKQEKLRELLARYRR